MHGKPLERGEKPRQVKDWISFTFKSSLLSESLRYYTWHCSSQKPFFFPYFSTQISLSLSVSYPNCSTTCSFYSTRNIVKYIKTGVKLSFPRLYYAMARGERKSNDVGVVGWKVVLLHCKGQVLDKKRDVRGARSDARVLNIGPT